MTQHLPIPREAVTDDGLPRKYFCTSTSLSSFTILIKQFIVCSYVSKIIENAVSRNLDLYAGIRATFSNRRDVVFDSDLDIVQPQINHNWVRGWWLIRE